MKRCPFCASTEVIVGFQLQEQRIVMNGEQIPGYFGLCMKCFARGPLVTAPPLPDDEAAIQKATDLWDCLGTGRAHE